MRLADKEEFEALNIKYIYIEEDLYEINLKENYNRNCYGCKYRKDLQSCAVKDVKIINSDKYRKLSVGLLCRILLKYGKLMNKKLNKKEKLIVDISKPMKIELKRG